MSGCVPVQQGNAQHPQHSGVPGAAGLAEGSPHMEHDRQTSFNVPK
ncbi:MAG TPA: hypothetical protein VFU32_00690 [Ktedonobacterales bacterium]|nr:hypothetical protein [Ktedonobacterales bacterium]